LFSSSFNFLASSEEHPEDTEFVVVGSDGDLVCFAGDARIEVLYDSFSGTYFLRSELLRELGLEGRPDLLLVCYSMCKGSNVEFTGLVSKIIVYLLSLLVNV
jgi:hypothetical protein